MIKRKVKMVNFGVVNLSMCKHTEIIFAEGEDKITCSKCNEGFMIKRKGKYVYFLGCSTHSKCKNIQKIKNDKINV